MAIYTRQGDFGETGLPGGERVSKNCPRTEACGTLDEVNASIGLLLAQLPDTLEAQRPLLRQVQSDLYSAACHLAGTGTDAETLPVIRDTRIEELEKAIDTMTDAMPELRSFVLPCGCQTAAQSHVARTVCRRAERRIVNFLETLPAGGVGEPLYVIICYVNRLSDYLFTLARYTNHTASIDDTPWDAEPAR
jgi:cob(I)alamin adenosyltransferase